MNRFHRIPRIHPIAHLVSFLATCACATLGLVVAAPAAFAIRLDPTIGGSSGVAPTNPIPSVTRTVVTNGMPGWQITLIVAVVAVLAAAIAIIVDRKRSGHRTGIAPAT